MKFIKFKNFLKESYKRIERFSIPIVDMGIGKREKIKKISESIVPYNKAKKQGLFNKSKFDNSDEKVTKFNKRISRRNDELHSKYLDHEESQEELPYSVTDALREYSDGSHYINNALFKEHLGRGGLDEYDRKPIKELDEAMRMRKVHGGIVYTGLGTKIHSNIGDMLRRGVVHNPSYTSTSHNIRIASTFADYDKDKNQHVLEIHLPKDHPGVYMPRYSEWDDEKETLLPRGMSFKIHKNPRIYKHSNGNIYHIWKAHPISKEEADREHNKMMDKLLRNGNVNELRHYYDHEASEGDKRALQAIITADPDKQLEYYGDSRNHGLLAANPNLRDDIKGILENSNKPGIQKYFAGKTWKPELIQKYLRNGHYEELSKNGNIDNDQARELIERSGGHNKVLNNLISSLERTGSSTEHDKKLVELMPHIIRNSDNDIKKMLVNKYFYASNGTPQHNHLNHLIDMGDDSVHAHLIQQRGSDLNSKQRMKLYHMGNGERKEQLMPHLNVAELNGIIENGNDEDRERIAKNILAYSGTGEDEIIKKLVGTKNPKVISHVKRRMINIPYSKETHELLDPSRTISSHDIKKYIENPETHHILIHNSDLANSDIKELIDKNPSLVNHMFYTGINYDGDVLSHVLKHKRHLNPESNVLMMRHSLRFNKPKQDMINHIKKDADQASKDVLKFKYGIE